VMNTEQCNAMPMRMPGSTLRVVLTVHPTHTQKLRQRPIPPLPQKRIEGKPAVRMATPLEQGQQMVTKQLIATKLLIVVFLTVFVTAAECALTHCRHPHYFHPRCPSCILTHVSIPPVCIHPHLCASLHHRWVKGSMRSHQHRRRLSQQQPLRPKQMERRIRGRRSIQMMVIAMR